MKTTQVPANLRRWLERRLLSAEPTCDAFELRYLNDGSPLGTLSAPQGGKLENVIKTLFDELAEIAQEHALTSDGMHRFSVEAFGPRPERRSLGSYPFALTTTGAAPVALLDECETTTLPTAFDALERVMGKGEQGLSAGPNRMQDLALLLQSIQGVTGSAVPAATLKVGLDFSREMARLFVEVLPGVLRIQNETITAMAAHVDTMRERDIATHEMVSKLLMSHDLRKLELKQQKKKEKRKDERLGRLWNTAEAMLPDLIEHFRGETPVLELLNTLDDQQMAALMQFLSPQQRKLIEIVVRRAKKRSEKIKEGGKTKKKAASQKEARQ